MSWTIRPVSASTQTANICFPSVVAVVTQICFSQITGEDHPRSWMAVFQTTLLVSLHESGVFAAIACPFRSGPRNSGQLAVEPADANKPDDRRNKTATIKFTK